MSPDTLEEPTATREIRGVSPSSRREGSAPWDARLVVLVGTALGKVAAVKDGVMSIGRAPTCELMLDEDSVSRHHARITWTGEAHRLEDLGSTNGTFVGSSRIESRLLLDGDRIHFGRVVLKYMSRNNVEAACHSELGKLARHDGLTGLYNRRAFEEALVQALTRARHSGSPLSLLTFDVDHFKRVNDVHGHAAGDAVLQLVADTVGSALSEGQLAARIGGEEFAVMCPGFGLDTAREEAERLRRLLEHAKVQVHRTTVEVTASFGVAEANAGDSLASLFQRADELLYAAKSGGRNCVR